METLEIIEYKQKIKLKRVKDESKKFSIQFLPESLTNFSQSQYFDYKDKKLKTAYIIDLIHTLVLKYYFKKENLFHLSSIILKDKYGYLYNYYIDWLIDNNILILVQNYLKGKNTRVYKLNEIIISDKINRYRNSDRVLLKKYKNAVSDLESEKNSSNKILPEIKARLIKNLYSVKIEYEKSIYFLDSTLQDVDIYNRNKYSVECIKQNQLFYHFDDFGRFHTNFTILKSFIRKNCLKIDDDETFELDIKNSQPLFLNLIIKEQEHNIDTDELNLFKFLTTKGVFYDYLIEQSEIKEKKLIKECIYKVFFGKNGNSKCDKFFRKFFPSIHDFIKEFKLKNKNYKILAHKLQYLESNLIFNKIIKEIYENYNHVNLVTIHDSIVCAKKNKLLVEEIFYRKLKEEFDF